MADIRDLYQEAILDHYKNPRNSGTLDNPTATGRGHNPLCGDKITVYLDSSGQVISDLKFQASACAICTSSASIMSQIVKGLTFADATAISHDFIAMARGDAPLPEHPKAYKLVLFGGISEFASRVKCATLPWHALESAMQQSDEAVTTE